MQKYQGMRFVYFSQHVKNIKYLLHDVIVIFLREILQFCIVLVHRSIGEMFPHSVTLRRTPRGLAEVNYTKLTNRS